MTVNPNGQRYFVIKVTELEEAIRRGIVSRDQYAQFASLLSNVHQLRISKGKPALVCAVVQSNWQEFDVVMRMLQQHKELEALRLAARNFVHKCDSGMARSKHSYAEFTAALALGDKK